MAHYCNSGVYARHIDVFCADHLFDCQPAVSTLNPVVINRRDVPWGLSIPQVTQPVGTVILAEPAGLQARRPLDPNFGVGRYGAIQMVPGFRLEIP